ncbi:hypothetical protein M3Y99_01629000 [Aphelenchoides fujianensis]|nr:hypothetical protein M3Y99_01629000 [Aphelenchoides fujianensis]
MLVLTATVHPARQNPARMDVDRNLAAAESTLCFSLQIPKKILLPDERLDEKRCALSCTSEFIGVWSVDALFLYTTDDSKLVHVIRFDFNCTAFGLWIKGVAFLMSDRNELFSLDIQSGKLKSIQLLPPLGLPPASALIVRHSFLAVASGNLLFHYALGPAVDWRPTYYDSQLKTTRIPFEADVILMEPRHIAVLFRKRQVLCVFLLENTNHPEYEFHFTAAENVIAACWAKNALYTLTDDGVLSKWVLLTYGRKIRERYLKTQLQDCFKILAVENDKFFICCKNKTVGIKWNT